MLQVNFLSHWLIAHELLAAQRKKRKSKFGKNGYVRMHPGTRLVMLSSLTHHAGRVQWNDKQV